MCLLESESEYESLSRNCVHEKFNFPKTSFHFGLMFLAWTLSTFSTISNLLLYYFYLSLQAIIYLLNNNKKRIQQTFTGRLKLFHAIGLFLYPLNKKLSIFCDNLLTYFRWLISFYTPRKHQKIKVFLMFSGGIEKGSSMNKHF